MSDVEDQPRERGQDGPFAYSKALRATADDATRPLTEVSLQDLHEIKLLLRSESVIDWHRLYIDDESQARRLFQLCGLDVDSEADHRRLEALRSEAANYITTCLKLRLDDYVNSHAPVESLPMLASKEGKYQRSACTLLKVMHIIHHLNARELRTVLSIPDNELFAEVESSVVLMFDELRAAGVPVVEFSWSRKTRESQITKLLVKRDTSAARIFDRLRFRVIVENREDLGPTLHVMLHRCIPFNYVAPGQTVNNLVETTQFNSISLTGSEDADEADPTETNEFSSQQFRVLNFIADLPVRVDALLDARGVDSAETKGRVVFILAEFQVLDRATAKRNEQGESAHDLYKQRQHGRVRERLLRTPGKRGG
jgi:uncharacterized protein (TIGR04552 family)